MTNFRKSVPMPANVVGAGAAKPKKPEINIVYIVDILSWPERDGSKVKMLGNIVLVPGAKMEKLYMTPSSQKISQETEGDEDMEVFVKKAEGIYPGNPLGVREFVANNIGVGVVLIFGEGCGDKTGDVLGSPCNPMKLKGSYSSDKDGVKNNMQYAQYVNDNEVIGLYDGEVFFAENHLAATAAVDFTIANGPIYQLPSLDATASVTAASIDIEHGTIITLIGGGGADPATLSSGVHGDVSIVLKDDTTWTGLDKAVINVQVYNAGATTYLIEQSRA
ncbi:hypothetical protein [Flavicella sp.]|uniref:hypothetical protein n=1 Tax=Flavicella sp. TaxID=2957742 RepID=UPI003019DEF7